MSAPKWTPGPWDWHASLHDDGRNNGSVLSDVASGRARCVCKAPQYQHPDQWQADANLIAAAPELYEALVLAEDRIESERSPGEWDPLLREIRAAIAKARGEQS